ncbi:MAG: endonuclease/exonuclease/phosphatase family protein [Spirochaetaceae bacterium]|nr:endonuclease/exonuclease/phosphatase family protein [Spirochaetaceae bacterium]
MAALLFLLVLGPGARVAADTGAISVLSYNVQNLFDAMEQGAEYDEFRAGRWDAARYAARLNRIAAVLRDVHPGGADILALQEVENRRAALDLRDRLRDLGYAYVVAVPNDGADLGLTLTPVVLSRLPVLRVRLHQVWHGGRYLRPIVEAELDLGGGRSLFLFNNHWKSKRGGAEETAPARRAATTVLGDRIRELQRTDPLADLLVTGDLNESVDDHAAAGYPTALAGLPRGTAGVLAVTGRPFDARSAFDARPPAGGVVLYSPWLELEAAGRGTVVHRDAWETPDHFLLSAGLFDREGVWYAPGGFAVIRDGLVSPATGYPLRWIGTDGHSDHLPILLHLQREGSRQ